MKKNSFKLILISIISLTGFDLIITNPIQNIHAAGDPRQKANYNTIFRYSSNENGCPADKYRIKIDNLKKIKESKSPDDLPILTIVNGNFGKDYYWNTLNPPGWDPKTWKFVLKEATYTRGGTYLDDAYYYFECVSGNCEKMAIQVNNGAWLRPMGDNIHAYYKSDPSQTWFNTARGGNQIKGNFCADTNNDSETYSNLKEFLEWAQPDGVGGDQINTSRIPFADNNKVKSLWTGVGEILSGLLNSIASGIDIMSRWILDQFLIVDLRTESNTKTAVFEGWTTVRNASNILLILGLLFIAVANAVRFQIDYYTAKMLIPRFIIAAVFINFSHLMTMAILDLANVLTYQFSHEIQFVNLILPSGLQITSAATAIVALVYGIWGTGGFGWVIFGALIAIIILIAILTLVTVLILRMVIIYLLVVFSPLVFLFSVLPFTRGLTSIWWSYLTRWVFMGPVIALILMVASKI